MSTNREQFSNDIFPVSSKAKKWLKRQLARWNRRQGKKNPEEAPKKNRYKGWSW
jgi:hypothetical protein